MLWPRSAEKEYSRIQTRRRVIATVVKRARLLCGLLVVLGIAAIVALPQVAQKTYFSENSLLTASAKAIYSKDDLKQQNAFLDRITKDSSAFRDEVQTIMEEIGLETHRTNTYIYGVHHAPRSDGVEAIVLSSPITSSEKGVALVLGLARFATHQRYWAKDIIFLVADNQGAQDFLADYMGPAVRLPRGGLIQANLNIVMTTGTNFSHISVLHHGYLGRQPNLDFINVAVHTGAAAGATTFVEGVDKKTGNHSKLWRFLKGQATMSRDEHDRVHDAFLMRNIDAISLKAIPAKKGSSFSKLSVPQDIEMILRSLNNLLEKFHQSFFFYVLLDNRTFISIANFMIPLFILWGAFVVDSVRLYNTVEFTAQEALGAGLAIVIFAVGLGLIEIFRAAYVPDWVQLVVIAVATLLQFLAQRFFQQEHNRTTKDKAAMDMMLSLVLPIALGHLMIQNYSISLISSAILAPMQVFLGHKSRLMVLSMWILTCTVIYPELLKSGLLDESVLENMLPPSLSLPSVVPATFLAVSYVAL